MIIDCWVVTAIRLCTVWSMQWSVLQITHASACALQAMLKLGHIDLIESP